MSRPVGGRVEHPVVDDLGDHIEQAEDGVGDELTT
jgi:hypothetical protein